MEPPVARPFFGGAGEGLLFHTQYLAGMPGSTDYPHLVLEPVDSDEAAYLIAISPMSVFRPYKEPGIRQDAHNQTR
jgi:hypothetical protein